MAESTVTNPSVEDGSDFTEADCKMQHVWVLLDLIDQEVAEKNNSDFDKTGALSRAVRNEINDFLVYVNAEQRKPQTRPEVVQLREFNEARNVLLMKSGQLLALTTSITGEGFEPFCTLNERLRHELLGLIGEVAHEVDKASRAINEFDGEAVNHG